MPYPTRQALVALLLVACSAKAPGSRDSSRATPGPGSAAAAAAVAALPPPDPREEKLADVVLQAFEQEHLLRKKIDDEVSREAFATYVDRLDGGKMFLLASDRDELAKYETKIDDQLRSGRLDLAHDGARIYVSRVAEVEAIVARLLAAPMNLTDEEFIELDPDKVALAETDAELSERWRRRLELEVLERVASMEARLEHTAGSGSGSGAGSGSAAAPDDEDDVDRSTPVAEIPKTPELREAKAREDLAKSYAARFTRLKSPAPLEAAADMINAVATTLDPHTTYLPPADKANFDIQMSGQLEGIGASLREHDHLIEIVELIPGGAGWRHGGLTAGDLILSVAADGKRPVDVFDLPIDEVVKMIRGPAGTVVKLRIQKASGEQQTVSITRDVVVIEAAYARGAIVSPKGKASYGYINLPSFYGGNGKGQRTAAGDVEKLLAEFQKKKVSGVVLDLRSNGGGLLGDAIEMTGSLIDEGPVVQVQDSRGKREVFGDSIPGDVYDGPLVVLVDRFSASASEIVAGALQDYHRAVVVGTGPTHGKGTVQTLADLDRAVGGNVELGVLKLTIQQFFRVSGASTQLRGVVPDIVLPDPAGYVDAGERELDHAIEWSQVDPAQHTDWAVTYKLPTLVQQSAARVAKDPYFAKVATTTALLRTRRNDTRVPLARPAWEARRKEQRAALTAASPDVAKMPPRLTVKPIEETAATKVAPAPATSTADARPDDRITRWRDALARDPWVEESVLVLHDMAGR